MKRKTIYSVIVTFVAICSLNSCEKTPDEKSEKTRSQHESITKVNTAKVVYNEESTTKLQEYLLNEKVESNRNKLRKAIKRNLEIETNLKNESKSKDTKKASIKKYNSDGDDEYSADDLKAFYIGYSSSEELDGRGDVTSKWEIVRNRFDLWHVYGTAKISKSSQIITDYTYTNYGYRKLGCYYPITGISNVSSYLSGITSIAGITVEWEETSSSCEFDKKNGWAAVDGIITVGNDLIYTNRQPIESVANFHAAYLKPSIIGKDNYGQPIYGEDPCEEHN